MRETLSIRDPKIERLLASIPYELGADGPDVRRFTIGLVRHVSEFSRNKAKRNALAKGQRHV